MKVGSAAAAAVTVEAQVDTGLAALDTGERSDMITAKDLNTLTVVGRDAGELVRMLPGYAMSTGNQGLFNRPGYNTAVVGLSGPTGAFSANGAGVTGIATVTDGVSLTDIATNSGSVQQMNIEMVQEVKATSSSYGAATAKGPAVISADSKTGGHIFHGEAYLAARDTDLNSNDWYDNYLRQSRPAGRYFYPGGQIGGPLLLPFTSFNRTETSCSSSPGSNTTTRALRPTRRRSRPGCRPWPNGRATSAPHRSTPSSAARARTGPQSQCHSDHVQL